jgi:hypothetical protein
LAIDQQKINDTPFFKWPLLKEVTVNFKLPKLLFLQQCQISYNYQ